MRSKHKRQKSLDEILTKEYNRHRFRWWRRIGYFFLTMLLLAVVVGGVGYLELQKYIHSTPSLNVVFKSAHRVESNLQQGSIQYVDSSGHPFYEVKTVSYQPISLNDVKKATNVTHALVATEDRDFYHEKGVNWLRTFKAGFDTYVRHRSVTGGSTITQQLIKLSYFSTSQKDQTIKRKVQEIILAEKLSKKYSKDQILTWYLNRVNYGNGQQGIVSAAHFYYDKTPRQLTKLEAATLVGIVNSPTMYNPYIHPNLMQQRRNIVLKSMFEMKYITKRQYQQWSKIPVSDTLVSSKVHLHKYKNDLATRIKYDGFITAADRQLKQYHLTAKNRDLVVKTSMNESLQSEVENVVDQAKFADSKLEEGLVVFNNNNGQVAAMSSGRYPPVIGGYNRAIDLKRSSGSSIKPLLDYGPGFDMYGWNADTVVEDTPFAYPGTNVIVHDWDNGYQGDISLRQALVQSRNIPAVRALTQVGLANGRKVLDALDLGNGSLFYPNAIGVDTSPLKMASAYSSLASGGYRVNPRFVTQVSNLNNHKKLLTKPVYERVYSQQTTNRLNHILQGVFKNDGTATRADISGSHQAGKTGTVGRNNYSNALTDGWMIGYTKSYTVAVWVGYDNPYGSQILTNDTAYVAQDMYKAIMKKVMRLDSNSNADWNSTATTNVDDDFRVSSNRFNARLPFYIDMTPSQLFGQSKVTNLNQLYQKVKHENTVK